VATTFDVVTNFNHTGVQPAAGDPFTYGTETALNVGFTLLPYFGNTNHSGFTNESTNDGTMDNWYFLDQLAGPAVGVVATGGTLTFLPNSTPFVIPNDVLMMMPGSPGFVAPVVPDLIVTRFTAPNTGLFDLAGSFTDLQEASVGLAIVVNGTTVWNSSFTGSSPYQGTISFSIHGLSLVQGATVDFVVDSLGNQADDVVGLKAHITELTVQGPPPTANPYFTHDILGQQDSVAAPGVLASVTPGTSGDPLTVSAVNGSAANVAQTVAGHYGSLQLFSDGQFIYTASGQSALPSSGVSEDFFGYTALEGGPGGGGSASSTLTVVVTAPGLTYVGAQAGQTIQGPKGHSPVLDGSAGNDILLAGKGATVLVGGNGDTLTGNVGADTYVFMGPFGHNTITNFNPNKDIIQLDHNEFADLNAVMKAALPTTSGTVITGTVITDPHNSVDTITLSGVSPSQLHFDASHFLLA
jgi:hypothetical protein